MAAVRRAASIRPSTAPTGRAEAAGDGGAAHPPLTDELVASGDDVRHRRGSGERRLIYSVTKTYLAVLVLRLGIRLDESVRAWFDDPRLPDASLRRLLNHTSGIPDYTRLREYRAAELDHEAWPDEELLDRALALGSDFPAGEGWAYSNTGYLLLRLIVDRTAGFERALRSEILEPLGLRDTTVALEPIRLGDHTYDPRWVGHRTLVATAADVHRFWLAVARSELVRLELLTESVGIGEAVPGYVRPSYGLGVMHDPEWPHGQLVGHGGGGPGATSAAFVVLRDQPLIAVVLSADPELAAEVAPTNCSRRPSGTAASLPRE